MEDTDKDRFLNYLAGLIAGDGDLYYRRSKGEYRIRVSDSSKEFLTSLSNLINKSLGIRARVYKHHKYNCFILVIYNKKLYYEILRRIESNINLPTIEFARGLLDAEGGITKSGKKGVVRIHFTNKQYRLVKSFTTVLDKLGIKYYLTRSGSKFKVFIQNKTNVCLTIKTLKPTHPKIIKQALMFLNNCRIAPSGSRTG